MWPRSRQDWRTHCHSTQSSAAHSPHLSAPFRVASAEELPHLGRHPPSTMPCLQCSLDLGCIKARLVAPAQHSSERSSHLLISWEGWPRLQMMLNCVSALPLPKSCFLPLPSTAVDTKTVPEKSCVLISSSDSASRGIQSATITNPLVYFCSLFFFKK